MNFIDRCVSVVNPVKGLERMRARSTIETIDKFQNNGHGYGRSGASRIKNALKGFFTSNGGPEKDITENIPLLRERSRDLYMSGPLGAGILKKYRTCVVGQGLVPKPNLNAEALEITQDKAIDLERTIKREFEAWARSQNVDAMRMHNFYTLQALALLSWVMNGDTFIIPRFKKRSGVEDQLCIQVIEADRIRNPCDDLGLGKIKEGVEVDDNGEVIAYHISNTHPGDDIVTKTVRIKAFNKFGKRNIFHIFEPERPDQRRGVPLLAPVIEALKQLTRYSEAELQAAVISGMYAVFIEQSEDDTESNLGGYDLDEDEKEFREETQNMELGNGRINILRPGEKMTDNSPGRPNANYKLFVDSIYEEIGAGIELPKEVMLNHFTSSYTAARASLEEAWRRFLNVRKILVDYMCQPIYEMFLLEQVANGSLELPNFEDRKKRREYCRAIWVGPNKVSIDPYKELKAAEIALNLHLTNREIIAQERGYDYDEVIGQKMREDKFIAEKIEKGGSHAGPSQK